MLRRRYPPIAYTLVVRDDVGRYRMLDLFVTLAIDPIGTDYRTVLLLELMLDPERSDKQKLLPCMLDKRFSNTALGTSLMKPERSCQQATAVRQEPTRHALRMLWELVPDRQGREFFRYLFRD